MRMRTTGWLVAAIAAGCAGPVASQRGSSGRRQAVTVRAAREIARLEAERDSVRRAEAERALASVAAMTDASDRRRAVARALALDPHAVGDLDPTEIAALAPDVLRVYDLGPVLDDGLDDPASVALVDEHDRDLDGGGKFLTRVAGLVRDSMPATSWDGATTAIEPAGDCLVVLQSPGEFAEIERALDRFATVGGATVRITGTATRDGERAELAFDVPFNRRRGAVDGSQFSFVKDFDADAASGFADPIVDTLSDGFAVTATYVDGSVELDIIGSQSSRPIPEFTTYLVDRAGEQSWPVRLQIPEMRAGRNRYTVAVADAPATKSLELAGWTVAVRVDAPTANSSAARPGWHRVERAAAGRAAEAEPLVENAIQLAEVHLVNDNGEPAARALETAVLGSRGASWILRVRLGPGGTEAALLRRPVDRSEADVLSALDDFGVRMSTKAGFLTVRHGTLAACVAPDSVSAVSRALGAISRSPKGSAGITISSPHPGPDRAKGCDAARPGHAATCTSAEQISFIQDFDLELAEESVIADPIIGVVQSGAMVSARPVPSSPGTFDVKVTHVLIERPIGTFTTPLGAGAPVTLQLPVMRRRQSTTRVTLAPGETLEMNPVFGTDERSFTLVRD